MTDNHEYNTPQKGEQDWASPLNSNFENLDTDVEIRDTETNKSDYTPKENALYRATDSGAVYIGDGTSWVLSDIQAKNGTFESVSTDNLDIGGDLPTGFKTLFSASGPNNQNILYKNFYSQTAVEQTKKTIFDQVVGGSAASVLVIGRDTSNNRFFDRVDYFGFGSSTDTELSTRGTPAARNYNVNGNSLELSVASDSFNVTAIGDEINTTEP